MGVQYKFGGVWQHYYRIGDTIQWDGNDVGSQGTQRVVAYGVADAGCPVCGYEGDWDFYVLFEHDQIVGVEAADGRYDFMRAGATYLELET
ncbi:MAG: hypothetical protein AB7S26_18300 [Sandaracinaceae bacterium]